MKFRRFVITSGIVATGQAGPAMPITMPTVAKETNNSPMRKRKEFEARDGGRQHAGITNTSSTVVNMRGGPPSGPGLALGGTPAPCSGDARSAGG
ncbi:hypothetical protein GCM10010286_22970 [Streptomyces toxytricini]|nr:hypothetical protein GCM10010286_22970 [Streptomyces toxytricini]